jgi:hypothetical protein
MRRKGPVQALLDGMAAGTLGAAVHSLYARASAPRRLGRRRRREARGSDAGHLGFGAGWGALYGLVRAASPRAGSAVGVAGFSLGAWVVGDILLLPALGWARPRRRSLRAHAHALIARLLYGAGTSLALAASDRVPPVPDVAAVDERHALVPQGLVEAPRHLARALARRARDLSR